MPRRQRSQRSPKRHPWRWLRQSHCGQILMFQDPQNGILLAHNEKGCPRLCTEVWCLPKIQQHPTPTSWTPTPNHFSMPFMKWGMDIVGKLPTAPGGKVFMLVMTDYFSKWIEAEAFTQVKDEEVVSFIKCNILTRFGIPSEIICDNGSQFISKKLPTSVVPGESRW